MFLLIQLQNCLVSKSDLMAYTTVKLWYEKRMNRGILYIILKKRVYIFWLRVCFLSLISSTMKNMFHKNTVIYVKNIIIYTLFLKRRTLSIDKSIFYLSFDTNFVSIRCLYQLRKWFLKTTRKISMSAIWRCLFFRLISKYYILFNLNYCNSSKICMNVKFEVLLFCLCYLFR